MKPTGKLVKKDFKLYLNDQGDAVGMLNEVETVQQERAGSKPIELTLNQEAVSGTKTQNIIDLPTDIKERLVDHRDPLQIKDLKVEGSRVKIKATDHELQNRMQQMQGAKNSKDR